MAEGETQPPASPHGKGTQQGDRDTAGCDPGPAAPGASPRHRRGRAPTWDSPWSGSGPGTARSVERGSKTPGRDRARCARVTVERGQTERDAGRQGDSRASPSIPPSLPPCHPKTAPEPGCRDSWDIGSSPSPPRRPRGGQKDLWIWARPRGTSRPWGPCRAVPFLQPRENNPKQFPSPQEVKPSPCVPKMTGSRWSPAIRWQVRVHRGPPHTSPR